LIIHHLDVEKLNRWQRRGLVCVVCERMFAPGAPTVMVGTVGTAGTGRAKLRACQGCVTDTIQAPTKRGRCVLWLSGQCHGDDACRCI
jgi:hypothetical protein